MTKPLGPAEVREAIMTARLAGDLDTALSYVATESYDQGRRYSHEDWRRKWKAVWAGIPDIQLTMDASVVSGEWMAARYTIRGTHLGDFLGQPPTGRRFEILCMDMIRVSNGKLVEHWALAEKP